MVGNDFTQASFFSNGPSARRPVETIESASAQLRWRAGVLAKSAAGA